MKSYLASMFSAQTPPPGSQEGLPYWILWFLLCVILLLFTFIFLRDKDLRQRLNQFLFGAKKRLIKFRLNTRLKIARRKKTDSHRELGQKVWEDNLEIPGGEKIGRTLHRLEEKRILFQKELGNTADEISKLQKVLDEKSLKNGLQITNQKAELKIENEKLSETRNSLKGLRASLAQKKKDAHKVKNDLLFLDKSLKETAKSKPEDRAESQTKEGIDNVKKAELAQIQKQIEKDIGELERQINEQTKEEKALKELIDGEISESKEFEDTSKREQAEIKKEIHEWERQRIKIQEKIQRIEKRKIPLYENLGSLTDENRTDHASLLLFYSQIDRANKKIEEIEKQLEELG